MIFVEQNIKGVWLIKPESFVDNRGEFRRHFCQKELLGRGIDFQIRQANISENRWEHTLRGFHYQVPPFEENKIISCLRGAIYDIVLDLRSESETFLKWISLEINDFNKLSLYVPAGCTNAYLSLSDNTAIHYYMSEFYSAESYRGIRYNDPLFNFVWPANPKVISEKDRDYPDFIVGTFKM